MTKKGENNNSGLSTMLFPILIFQLLLINFGLPESTEPALDELKCVNDYESEMTCHLTSEKLGNFSEYKLKMYKGEKEFHACNFERINSSLYECKLQVAYFVLGEIWNVSLLKKENILFSKQFNTAEWIKPKAPIIVSVKLTKIGNLLVTWDTGYDSVDEKKVYTEGLSTELVYGVKAGGPVNMLNRSNGITFYEIVGKNLQPDSEYFVKARVSTDYNDDAIFSDFSQPYNFSTPTSMQKNLQIIIPISCIIVIILISTVYCCYVKVKTEWWDALHSKIVSSGLIKEIHSLSFSQTEFSPLHVDNPKLDHIDSKTSSILSSQTNLCKEQLGCQNLQSDIDSPSMEYSQVKSGSEAQNSAISLEMSESYKAAENSNRIVRSYSNSKVQKCSGNNSGLDISNMCYIESTSGVSCFSYQGLCLQNSCNYNSNESINPLLAFSKKSPNSLMTRDFECGPCNGCSGPVNTQFTPSSTETLMVSDYQSVSEVNDQTNRTETNASKEQTFIGNHPDLNLIKQMCNKDSLDVSRPACDGAVISVDSRYQDFQSLEQNTGELGTETEQNTSQTTSDTVCHCGKQ